MIDKVDFKFLHGWQGLLYLAVVFVLFVINSVVLVKLPGLEWHDQQRAFQICFLLVVAFSCLICVPRKVSGMVFGLLLIVFVIGFISSLLSEHPWWAFKEWGRYLGLLLLVFLVVCIVDYEYMVGLLFFGMLIVAVLNVFQYFVLYLMIFATGLHVFDTDVLLEGFSNPRFLNQFQVMAFPLLAWLCVENKWAASECKRVVTAGVFFVLMAHWCMAFSLGGRALVLSIFGSHGILLLFFRQHMRLLWVQFFAAIFGFILFYMLFELIPGWFSGAFELRGMLRDTTHDRLYIWQLAWDMFVDSPWLGVGPMHFSFVRNSVAAHPHQMILQWLAEWGWLATLSVAGLMAWGMWTGLKHVRLAESKPMDAALWLSLCSILLMAQVDGVFVMPYTEIWLAILAGIAVSRWMAVNNISDNQCSILHIIQQYSWKLSALVVIVIMGGLMLLEVPKILQPCNIQAICYVHGVFPRFWTHGWIPVDALDPGTPSQ